MIYTLVALDLIFLAILYLSYFAYKKKDNFIRKNYAYLVVGAISLIFFFEIMALSFQESILTGADFWLYYSAPSWWSSTLTNTMVGITTLGNVYVLGMFFLILFLLLTYRKYREKRNFHAEFFIILGASLVLDLVLKLIIKRERPFGGLITLDDYSFPSGHALMATVFFFMLVYFFINDFKSRIGKGVFTFICVLIALLIGFSRIYLRVHWFSDVLAGLLLGIAVGCLGVLGVRVMRGKKKI